MIFIDLEHKLPTDTDIPNWTPWTKAQWEDWLNKSQQLVAQLAELDAAGKRDERNALIDQNSGHWGKLKPWLLALSYGKCWFSEVRELYSHYDIEHFRPKKEAKALDGSLRDGYWWLAFNYMNFRVCGNVGNRKKGGWFPLKQDSLCSTYTKPCEESETCYLLDPIDEDDVALIMFDEEGKATPRPDTTAWEQERVRETIKRLKLNEHVALTEARCKIWQQVNELLADYTTAKIRYGDGINPAAKPKMNQARTRLRELTDPTAELSSVARWCLRLRTKSQYSGLELE